MFERGQFGQRVLSHEQVPQRRVRVSVQTVLDQLLKAAALGHERVGDDGLQRRVARPDDFAGIQEPEHLDQDKGWRHISLGQQRGRLDQGRPVDSRPEPVAEQFGDLAALHVLFVFRQRLERHAAAREVLLDQEGDILGRHLLRGKVEEGVLRLEIAHLQQTVEALDMPLASLRQSAFRFGEGKELRALEVVEIRQAVERKPLGLRQYGQAFAVAGARRSIKVQGLSTDESE